MRLSRSERAILLAGRHEDEGNPGGIEESLVNVFQVARLTGIRPGSVREFIFAMCVPLLGYRKLVRPFSEGWYVLTDRGRLERELLRATAV
jgi:hypothetical protein